MKTPPYVNWYASDFLSGCLTLPSKLRDLYGFMLTWQANSGAISGADGAAISALLDRDVAEVKAVLEAKFEQDENGDWINKRMMAALSEAQRAYSQKVEAGKAGAKARWKNGGANSGANSGGNGVANGGANANQNQNQNHKKSTPQPPKGGEGGEGVVSGDLPATASSLAKAQQLNPAWTGRRTTHAEESAWHQNRAFWDDLSPEGWETLSGWFALRERDGENLYRVRSFASLLNDPGRELDKASEFRRQNRGRFAKALRKSAGADRCDGNHAEPPCGDPDCWHGGDSPRQPRHWQGLDKPDDATDPKTAGQLLGDLKKSIAGGAQ